MFKLNPGPMSVNYSRENSSSSSRLSYCSNCPLNTLKLCLLNTQSIKNKTAEFLDFVCECKADLFAITETWLNSMDDAVRVEICPTGYKFLDHTRVDRRGGGTGILYRESMDVSKVAAAQLHSFEYSEWKVKSDSQRLRLIVVYRPPYSDQHPVTAGSFLDEFSEFLESAVLTMEPLIIVGDFNIHLDCTENHDAVRLGELLDSTGLKQHVTVPTQIHGHTLDLVITRQSDNIINTSPWTDCLFSDHLPVFCLLQLEKPSLVKSCISYRKIKSINFANLREDIVRSDLFQNYQALDLNELVHCYDNTLSTLLDSHAPLITKTVVKRPIVPWFTEEVKEAKRQRRKAERKWRRTRLHCDLLAYKAKKNHATYIINRSRRQFYTDFITENSGDQKSLFKAAKTLFSLKSDVSIPYCRDPNVLANDVGKYFFQKIERLRSDLDSAKASSTTQSISTSSSTPSDSSCRFDTFSILSDDDMQQIITNSSKKTSSLDPMPTPVVVGSLDVLLPVLTRMVNLSLESGVFPGKWKIADVRPILKKQGLDPVFTNLRPISNLAFTSKLTERAVFNQMHNHLTVNGLYPKYQSAYRVNHSTETALLRVKHDLLMNMNDQQLTLLVLLDLSSAFDTVDHNVLLDRLNSQFGISGRVMQWFKSYLSNRSQFVTVNGGLSRNFELRYGVPQGSCLGPLLFVLYSSELFSIIKKHLPTSHAFADDTQLYISFKPDSDIDKETALTAMRECILDIKQWMLSDKLKLNDSKTEIILIGTRQQLAKVNLTSFTFGDTEIALSSEVRNLGCWFDSHLTMNSHIVKTCKAAFYHLYNIRRIRKYLSHDTARILVNAFVTSRLDYCNSLLYGLPTCHISKLQRVQNAAARLICNISRFDHITPFLVKLHWLPVRFRIIFKILLITYKVYIGCAPEYLVDLVKLKLPSGRYNLRSNKDEFLLSKPTFRSLKTLGDRSFYVAAPKLWNNLPLYIRKATSIAIFKKSLKTYLFHEAFIN